GRAQLVAEVQRRALVALRPHAIDVDVVADVPAGAGPGRNAVVGRLAVPRAEQHRGGRGRVVAQVVILELFTGVAHAAEQGDGVGEAELTVGEDRPAGVLVVDVAPAAGDDRRGQGHLQLVGV